MTVGRGSGPIRWCGESAESLVVNQAGLCRMVAAHGAIRIAANLKDPHVVRRQRIEVDHPADQRLTGSEQELDRFERFD